MKMGKFLIEIGILLITIGLIVIVLEKAHLKLFRLPGDIVIRKDNITIYIPIITSIIISIIATVILNIIFRK